MNPKKKRNLIIAIAVLAILWIIGTVKKEKEASYTTGSERDLCAEAYMVSKILVKRSIPGPADFSIADFKCKKMPDGSYSIYSYVNTTVNVLEDVNRKYREGTKVNYVCKVKLIGTDRFDPSQWELIDLRFSSL